MKRLIFVTALFCAAVFSSCNEFDDTEIWNKLDNYEKRISALEELCKQMNTNISALQTIVTALQDNDYVTGVVPISKEGETIGYTITFSKSDPITIYHGKDGHTPQIGVKPDTDNIYYWTLDGDWLLDDSGNKIQAQGISPKLKVEDDYWHISYDNGTTWEQLSKATGEDADSFFKDVTANDDYVIFTLADGTELTVPRTAPVSGNKIYYTTSDNVKIFPNSTDHLSWGAILVSNVYTNGQGVLTFDDSVTKIGDNAFEDITRLTSITIPDSVTKIDIWAFGGCSSLTSITIPDSVTSIGGAAFANCSSLTNVTIGNGITKIGGNAFAGCSSLTSITVPDSVTEIESSAFNDCTSLTEVYCKATTPPTGGNYMFDYNASGRKIYVPRNSVSAYKAAEYWCDYAADIVGYDFE